MKFSAAGARTLSVAVLMAIAGSATAQQPYPSKPIRIIVPNPPGGSITALARLVGPKLTERWGQPVIVDNRPGGNGFIGGEALAKSPPDGHTVMFISNTHIITPILLPAPYDPIKGFAPVASLIKYEFILVLHPSVPANNLREFITLAKSKPGQLNYATSGSGNANHLVGELFNILAGVKLQDVPYKGGGPALVDLLGGQVELYFNVPITFISHIKSGTLKAIAVSGKTRLPALPQVPTFTEAGLPGFDVKSWQGVLAPAGTPTEIIEKLSAEMARIMAMADVKDRVISQGAEPLFFSPGEFATLMRADTANYVKVIKTANIKVGK